MMIKLESLLTQVLTKYPELKRYKFFIEYAPLSDAFADYTIDIQTGEIGIEVDSSLRNKDDSIKRGAIASEFSHILKDRKLSAFGTLPIFFERNIHGFSENYRYKYPDYVHRMLSSRGVKAFIERKIL